MTNYVFVPRLKLKTCKKELEVMFQLSKEIGFNVADRC